MLNDNIHDTRLATFLQKYLTRYADIDTQQRLRGLRLCGSQAARQLGAESLVYLTSNGEEAKFFGINTCNSAWSCPRCTAKNMAEKATRIACAIDALKKWHNLKACMITFTMPHMKDMTCQQSFDILKDAWRAFVRETKEKRLYKNITLKSGKKTSYIKGANIYGKFRDDLEIKHFIKIYETTWGKKSWHPHIHSLFFIPAKKFQRVKDYEDKLYDYWWHCLKKSSLKIFRQTMSETDAKAKVEFLYSDDFKYPDRLNYGHRALFVSKTPTGAVKEQSSSYYLAGFNGAGWGAENELTGLSYKQARKNHYTPYQILDNAYKNPKYRDFWMNLYIEFAIYTRGMRRMAFSKSGINDIIDKWMATETYIETLKKKFTGKDFIPWKVVCSFTEEQWKIIRYLDLFCDRHITETLLTLAIQSDAREKIRRYLLPYNIKLRPRDKYEEFIENQIFANKAAA